MFPFLVGITISMIQYHYNSYLLNKSNKDRLEDISRLSKKEFSDRVDEF